MRYFTLALGIALLAGCDDGGIKPSDATPPPLCTKDKKDAPGTYSIMVDVAGKTVTPDECRVVSGSYVYWWETNGKSFETNFPGETAATWWKHKFKSKKIDSHHEAHFKAKGVDVDDSKFPYDVTFDDTKLDPAIIVDPHQNK